jgi:hypothetical protein
MSELININQTILVHGRSIMKTLVAHELINFRNKHNIPSTILKINFIKVFDIIS